MLFCATHARMWCRDVLFWQFRNIASRFTQPAQFIWAQRETSIYSRHPPRLVYTQTITRVSTIKTFTEVGGIVLLCCMRPTECGAGFTPSTFTFGWLTPEGRLWCAQTGLLSQRDVKILNAIVPVKRFYPFSNCPHALTSRRNCQYSRNQRAHSTYRAQGNTAVRLSRHLAAERRRSHVNKQKRNWAAVRGGRCCRIWYKVQTGPVIPIPMPILFTYKSSLFTLV